MRSRSWQLAVLALTFLAFATAAVAQSATTSLHGTVYDPKGAVVVGASVTIVNPKTGFTRATKSDNQGNYQFLELPPATYELTATASGFGTFRRTAIELLVSTPGTVNVSMAVTAQTVTVEVAGEAPMVNTQDASMGHAFGSEQILSLPFEGRDPTGILSLQPGVVFTGNSPHINSAADSRSGSVSGARSDQTSVTLDGVDNNDQLLGTAFQGAVRVPLDSLEEFKVTTSNSDADTGRSSGGQVSLVTKSGTNNIHGTLYEYYRPTFTTANDWFNKQAQLQAGQPNQPPFLLRNTFGVAIGGPIKRDRLFYFLSYEGQRKRESVQVTRVVPSMLMRQGTLQYPCVQDPVNDPACPPGGVATLTAAQLESIDTTCRGNGTCPATPGNPLGGGPNGLLANLNGANPSALFEQYPAPNSFTIGDGYDYQGFTFASPLPAKLDSYVAKIDYNITANGNHRIFVRGVLNNDSLAERNSTKSITGDGGSQFPGQPSQQTDRLNPKGLSVGYTATLSPTLINSFHFGYVRAGFSQSGLQTQHYVHLRGLDDLKAFTPTTNTSVPVFNWIDDLTKVRGSHTLQFGANFRRVDDERASNSISFFTSEANALWLNPACIANCGVSLDPATGGLGFAQVDPNFGQNYDFAVTALAGLVSEVDSNYNLTKTLSVLPEGAMVPRHYRNYESEFYAQDKWQVTHNLTMTYGLRYTLLQPPYETSGTQVAPSFSLHDWFYQRAKSMLQGQAYEPLVSFNLSGQANGKQPYWHWDYKDIAPRFAIAYAPSADSGWSKKIFGGPGKSSIRAGYGMYYDHFGEGITNTFDRFGSFGLSTQIVNAGGVQTVDGAARFSGEYNIPRTSATTTGSCTAAPCPIVEPPPTGSFPVTPPAGISNGGFSANWGLDDKLRTPYSHVVDLSITRELPANFIFEAAYVGRFAHHLLQEEDIGMPVDLVDPKSHMDYFTAATLLLKQVNAGTPIQNLAPIPFWENVFPGAAGPAATHVGGECGTLGTLCFAPGSIPASGNVTATQAIYDLYTWFGLNATSSLQYLDLPGQVSAPWPANNCYPSCATINGKLHPNAFYPAQFSSLNAWRSIGDSAYNAGQFSLRRRMTHGLEFDFNYTYSKSMDVGSNAERINEFEGFGFASQVLNAWNPKEYRSVSDFDATQQLNANWVWELPFGRGKKFASGVNSWVNGLLGGWEWSGLYRWSSGYPMTIFSPWYPTDWENDPPALLTGKHPKTGQFIVQGVSGPTPNVFQNPTFALAQFSDPFPGQGNGRNSIRGPGTFNIDSGLAKIWNMNEARSLKLSWEVFNVLNTPRFDVGTLQTNFNDYTSDGSLFGNFTSTLSNPRVMEFALRFTF